MPAEQYFPCPQMPGRFSLHGQPEIKKCNKTDKTMNVNDSKRQYMILLEYMQLTGEGAITSASFLFISAV